jgi:ribokinase
MRFDVVVVGSLNQDITVRVPHIPAPGETVLGGDARIGAGGKGANQAVAAARLGASVAMVGRVGGDAAGSTLRGGLIAEDIEVGHVTVDETRSSGTALITVDDAAENAIVVSPGANHAMTVDDVTQAGDIIATAQVVLLQLEVPLSVVRAAASIAGGTVILNPAPAADLDPVLLSEVDILVPNRGELVALLGEESEVDAMARQLAVGRDVVVTLGAAGAYAATRDGGGHLAPAPRVDAVDTVGAGDCFCGALGAALARGNDIDAAIRFATHAAAIAVTRRGAQTAMPHLDEVRALLGDG